MKKFFISLLLMTLAISTSMNLYANQVLSDYCSTPSGHLGIADFGDANGRIKLTISNMDATSLSVKVEPNGGAAIDFLYIEPVGYPSVTVGTDEGDLLTEYKGVVTIATPPATLTLNIMWSNPGWGGRWMIQNLQVPFNASCDVVITDLEAPVMGTAAVVGSPTYNSAVLSLTATDNVTSPVTKFIINDVTNGITDKEVTTTSGKVTLTGLNPATTYNLTVKAKDEVKNISANSATVSFTTANRLSSCSGDLGHFAPDDAVKHIHYELSYANGNVTYKVSTLDATQFLDFLEVHTTAGNFLVPTDGTSGTATYVQEGVALGTKVGIRFMYSTTAIGGNEMTAETVSLADSKIVYYVAGDCLASTTEVTTANTQQVIIAPNPVRDMLKVFTNGGHDVVVKVYALTGQCVASQRGSDRIEIDVRALSAGVYTVKVDVDGVVYTEKVIK